MLHCSYDLRKGKGFIVKIENEMDKVEDQFEAAKRRTKEGKCSWCEEPRTHWLMHQAFCDKHAKEFCELHKKVNGIK